MDGNIGAAIGALLPLVAGGAVLLRTPLTTVAAPPAAVAPVPVAPASSSTLPTLTPVAAAPAAVPVEPPPAPPNSATPQCLARFAIGLPRQQGAAVARRETLICRRGYVLAFDADTRDPDWAMERLAPADLTGSAVRSNAFQHDPALPANADASNADYLRTDLDRGHQSPAGDAKFAQNVMDQSFYLSNIAPQVGIGFNRGAWKFLEETVRAWVVCGGHTDLYVITGPIYGARPATIGTDRVAVPAAFFKIVYDGNSGRAVGFVLPNRKIGSILSDLQAYVQPIASIETETGLSFFDGFDRRRQAQLKQEAGTAWEHVATCPGESGD